MACHWYACSPCPGEPLTASRSYGPTCCNMCAARGRTPTIGADRASFTMSLLGRGPSLGGQCQTAGGAMSDSVTTTDRRHRGQAGTQAAVRATWTGTYLRIAALLDCLCGLAAGLIALEVRFDSQGSLPAEYFAFTIALPFLWLG